MTSVKKFILTGVLFVFVFTLLALPVLAYNPVNAEITIEIIGGGTAEAVPDVNCPVPEPTIIKIVDGETGRFRAVFTEVGIYTYTVNLISDGEDKVFDNTKYKVKIYVTDENGELAAHMIVYVNDKKYSVFTDWPQYANLGPERLLFLNTAENVPDNNESTTVTPDSNREHPGNNLPDKQSYTNKEHITNTQKNTNNDSQKYSGGKIKIPRTGSGNNEKCCFALLILSSVCTICTCKAKAMRKRKIFF